MHLQLSDVRYLYVADLYFVLLHVAVGEYVTSSGERKPHKYMAVISGMGALPAP